MPKPRPRQSVSDVLDYVVRDTLKISERSPSAAVSKVAEPAIAIVDSRLELQAKFRRYYFPKTIGDFWDASTAPLSHSLQGEIRNCVDIFSLYAQELNDFLRLRVSLEQQILTGDLEGAKRTLSNTKEILGESLWTIEAELLLAERSGGVDKLKIVLADLHIRTPSSYTKAITSQLGQRVGRNLSSSTYDANLEYFLSFLQETEYWRKVADALTFRLNFPRANHLRNLAFTVWTDNRWSLVDRYLMFVQILGCLTVYKDGTMEGNVLRE